MGVVRAFRGRGVGVGFRARDARPQPGFIVRAGPELSPHDEQRFCDSARLAESPERLLPKIVVARSGNLPHFLYLAHQSGLAQSDSQV